MEIVRGAASFIPVIGPVLAAADAAAHGDPVGAAVELAVAALDALSAVGAPAGRGTARLWQVQGAKLQPLARAGGAAGARRVAAAAKLVAAAAPRARHTVKTAVKRKVRDNLRRGALKVGASSVCSLAEVALQRRSRSSLPAATASGTFAALGSAEEQLHAHLCALVYAPCGERRGALAVLDGERGPPGAEPAPPCVRWYAYVGGDARRGFWHCRGPAGGHLVLAERGTVAGDVGDLRQDACLALGSGLAAVSARARAAREALKAQAACHECSRVTVCGHSLGGTVAAFLACSGPRGGPRVHGAHAFSPGGTLDLTRSLACALAPADIAVHRVAGDPISAAFLPHAQRVYAKRRGCEGVDPHRLLHFLS